MFNNILFVCIGNICRSPTAEYLLKFYIQKNSLYISSAGLSVFKKKNIDKTAQEYLLKFGINSYEHFSKQIDINMVRNANLILVMEKIQLSAIKKFTPLAHGKTFLLGKWKGDLEIPDPYHKERPVFEYVYKLIHESVLCWLNYL